MSPRQLPALYAPVCLLLHLATAEISQFEAPEPEYIYYGELGWVNTTAVWYSADWRETNPTPQTREEIGTHVELFTVRNPVEGEQLVPDSKKTSQYLKCSRPSKIIIHGWLSYSEEDWVKEMTKEILRREDVNVFTVGYTSSYSYWQTAQNIRVVALEIIYMLRRLQRVCSLQLDRLHFIGHSLGAHTAGYVGQALPGIARITGLDPAEPMFQFMPAFVTLDPSDASFVDVIHTNAGEHNIFGGFGLTQPVGNLDFYPNDGKHQPGCNVLDVPMNVLRKGITTSTADLASCSHSRAIELFIESINSQCPFIGFECASQEEFMQGKCASCGDNYENCALMGYDANVYPHKQRSQVKFFLTTASAPPYCLNVYLVVLEVGVGAEQDTQGILRISLQGEMGLLKNMELTENDDLVGRIPLIGMRIPNPLAASERRLPTLRSGETVTLLGLHPQFIGQHVNRGELYWEYNSASKLSRLLPCVVYCSRPLRVARLWTISLGGYPAPTVKTLLCPVNATSTGVVMESSTTALFTKEACLERAKEGN